jgi:MoaA/NifB/PqqE/SkfB family radical SAM enzyme
VQDLRWTQPDLASQGTGLQRERNLTLTPFVPGLSERVATAVRTVLALGKGVHVEALPSTDAAGKASEPALSVSLTLPRGRRIELELRAFASLSCRGTSAEDVALGRELAARLSRANADALKEMWDAATEQRRFHGIVDKMFRFVLYSPPYRMGVVRLGFRCNQDCHFCWQDRQWPEPPLEMYVRWIDEIAASGIDELCLTGGEPTLRKDLPELIRYARHTKGMRVHLQTNAIQLRREEYTRSLVAAGLHALLVSLHASVAEVSDEMTRAPGTFDRSVAGIEQALRCGLKVELNCLPDMTNRHVLAQYGEFVVERFVKPFPDNPIWSVMFTHPCRYYDPDDWQKRQAPYDLLAEGLIASTRTLEAAGVTNTPLHCCGFPPCIFYDAADLVGFVPHDDLAFRNLHDRTFVDACSSCAVRDRCPGVRKEYVEAFGTRGIRPFETAPENPIEYKDTHVSMFL